ncbi:ATP-binding protein [Peptococcaceae bacterium]|nr:ATP-binding protein [Peptococcaceae bacterium]
MLIREYRGDEFIDREKEIEFLKDWFESVPKEILWLYGPKSCGKTTLIEYVIENELFDDFMLFKSKKYNVKYINFRGKAISNYDSFINSFITSEMKDEKDLGVAIKLGMIEFSYSVYKRVQERRIDLFDALTEYFRKSKKTNVMVIDEIQVLEDIYINNERELIKEFLNLCVRLTKELHLCHVVILSSNTIFINRIYNEAKLKMTSEFKKIDHLNKDMAYEYLGVKGFSEEEKELIWEYLGGCIPRLQKMIRKKAQFSTLKEYLENEVELAKSEVKFFMLKKCSHKEIEIFKQIIKEILKKGYYCLDEENKQKDEYMSVIEKFSQIEILFFDPLTLKVTGNNRLYEKSFEKLT